MNETNLKLRLCGKNIQRGFWACRSQGRTETGHSSVSHGFSSGSRNIIIRKNEYILLQNPVTIHLKALKVLEKSPNNSKMWTMVGHTCESWGLFQLTGTRPLELDPEEVEDVLLVTAMTCGFPLRPAAVRWSPYLWPMMGVCGSTKKFK